MGNSTCLQECATADTRDQPQIELDPHAEDGPTKQDCAVLYSSHQPYPLAETTTKMEPWIFPPGQDLGFEGHSPHHQAKSLKLELPRLGLGKLQGFAGALSADTKSQSLQQPGPLTDSSTRDDSTAPSSSEGHKTSADAGQCLDISEQCALTTPVEMTADMPEPPSPPFLEIVFDAKGQEQLVRVFERPLGAELSKRRAGPTRISKVYAQSYASRLGLEVGWAMKSIGGEDMSRKNIQEIQDALKTGLMALPVCRNDSKDES